MQFKEGEVVKQLPHRKRTTKSAALRNDECKGGGAQPSGSPPPLGRGILPARRRCSGRWRSRTGSRGTRPGPSRNSSRTSKQKLLHFSTSDSNYNVISSIGVDTAKTLHPEVCLYIKESKLFMYSMHVFNRHSYHAYIQNSAGRARGASCAGRLVSR